MNDMIILTLNISLRVDTLSSDVCPTVCGGDTQCSVHSRSPVPSRSKKYGKQVRSEGAKLCGALDNF